MKHFLWILCLSSASYGKTIATINGKDISSKEIYDAILATSSNPLLVINDSKLTESFITNYIDELLIANSPEVLALKKQNDVKLSLARLERSELVRIWQQKHLEKKVSSGDLKKLAKAAAENGQYNQYLIQQILVSERPLAESILSQLLKDPSAFEAQSALHSLAPSKMSGGEMGWIGRSSLPVEFQNIVNDMTKDNIYPKVLETPFGFHILKLKDSTTLTAEQILQRPNFDQKLKAQLDASSKNEFLSALKKKAKIVLFKQNFSVLDQ